MPVAFALHFPWNPPDAAVGYWPAPWYKRIYKQFRPAKWVEQHWK